MKSARTLALELAIYNFCTPREWDVTIKEIADGIGLSSGAVKGVLISRGWNDRVRGQSISYGNGLPCNGGMGDFDNNPMFDG